MLNIDRCPVCEGASFSPFLTCKDHTVSGESFSIVRCSNCAFLFTNPIPYPDDLGKYYKAEAYVSHTSSNKGLINFLYNRVRKITLKQKIRLIKRIAGGHALLDVGCGTGHFLHAARSAGFKISGIEPDPDARALAKSLNQVEALPREAFASLQDRFDVITLWHVLEHLPELNQDVARLSGLLKEDGVLLIAVPNPDSFDANVYREHWAGYDVPRHLYHFSPDAIRRLFARHGFQCVEVLPMKFDAYYVSMLSEKSKNGSVLKGFLNGWRSNRMARRKPETWSSQIYLFRKK